MIFCARMVLPQALSCRPVLGKDADVAREIGRGRLLLERLERGPMHHQRDGDLVRPADALVVVADIAQHEGDLVEIGQMIDDLRFVGRGLRFARRRGGGDQPAGAGDESRSEYCVDA